MGNQILWPRAELEPHSPHANLDDAFNRAAPAGMEGRHRPALAVGDQHRNAVCGLDAQQQAELSVIRPSPYAPRA